MIRRRCAGNAPLWSGKAAASLSERNLGIVNLKQSRHPTRHPHIALHVDVTWQSYGHRDMRGFEDCEALSRVRCGEALGLGLGDGSIRLQDGWFAAIRDASRLRHQRAGRAPVQSAPFVGIAPLQNQAWVSAHAAAPLSSSFESSARSSTVWPVGSRICPRNAPYTGFPARILYIMVLGLIPVSSAQAARHWTRPSISMSRVDRRFLACLRIVEYFKLL